MRRGTDSTECTARWCATERVLGDRIRGAQGMKEKSDALAKLGKLIETIVNPPKDNVAALWA
jgi:hypothetical protein